MEYFAVLTLSVGRGTVEGGDTFAVFQSKQLGRMASNHLHPELRTSFLGSCGIFPFFEDLPHIYSRKAGQKPDADTEKHDCENAISFFRNPRNILAS